MTAIAKNDHLLNSLETLKVKVVPGIVREARLEEAETIVRLINFHAQDGEVLFRTLEDVQENISDSFVYEKNDEILGTCSLKYGWDKLVEIRSLAVDPRHYRQGVASALVEQCIDRAKSSDCEKIFVLTYAIPLFVKLQFDVIEKATLPLKIWQDCMGCRKRDHCDETAMIRTLR